MYWRAKACYKTRKGHYPSIKVMAFALIHGETMIRSAKQLVAQSLAESHAVTRPTMSGEINQFGT